MNTHTRSWKTTRFRMLRYLTQQSELEYANLKLNRLIQSMIYVPLLVNTFQILILLTVQYKYFKSYSSPESDPPHKIMQYCFITQSSWLLHFQPTKMVGQKFFYHRSSACSDEDETRNARRNAKRNPEWSSQLSFQMTHLKRNVHFDHQGFRLAFLPYSPFPGRWDSKLQNG